MHLVSQPIARLVWRAPAATRSFTAGFPAQKKLGRRASRSRSARPQRAIDEPPATRNKAKAPARSKSKAGSIDHAISSEGVSRLYKGQAETLWAAPPSAQNKKGHAPGGKHAPGRPAKQTRDQSETGGNEAQNISADGVPPSAAAPAAHEPAPVNATPDKESSGNARVRQTVLLTGDEAAKAAVVSLDGSDQYTTVGSLDSEEIRINGACYANEPLNRCERCTSPSLLMVLIVSLSLIHI